MVLTEQQETQLAWLVAGIIFFGVYYIILLATKKRR